MEMDKGMCMGCDSMHGKWHISCCIKPLLGKVLWLLSAAALVLAWVASASANGMVFQIPVAHLFWDALILGVLAIGLKGHGYGHGMQCMPMGGMEEEEEPKRKK